ncbi:phosphopantetheine adenylyltransferase [Methanobrevibacter sp. TMH8]|uniref:phosphopantetheine adenylyltransferase n=1 Tax=Methanobrevibacter sp. TMH8 TaxID=2848611 RepID=UPI001CCABDDE|nr:phosphopantetheine adenylyltransferase [Methanobrevibacter sp. TMH8]MBZ9571629.1 phosphopantetheine adenylyltransferase [Methanobrevibacter sp. TMH8]
MSIKKRYKKLAVGGTFDRFHNGHRKLLEEAFNQGEMIVIGVTSDSFGGKKGDIDSCNKRMENLNHFLATKHDNFQISRLDDPFGSTIFEENFDAIVVSEETEPTAHEINKIRKEKGMDPIDVIVISFVNADDGIPISSTRIRKGEIDTKGHLLK